jgi:hypothetical protein
MVKSSKGFVVALLMVLAFTPVVIWAGNMKDMPKKEMPVAFEKLKSLVGNWSGKTEMDGKPTESTVTYALTGGGTALVETLSKGQPNEMMSIYYVQGKKVYMTHYCMLGNHPEMTLTKSTENSLKFEMKGTKGISSKKEPHMHALTITFIDKDHFTADWVFYTKGKKGNSCKFEYKRK